MPGSIKIYNQDRSIPFELNLLKMPFKTLINDIVPKDDKSSISKLRKEASISQFVCLLVLSVGQSVGGHFLHKLECHPQKKLHI